MWIVPCEIHAAAMTYRRPLGRRQEAQRSVGIVVALQLPHAVAYKATLFGILSVEIEYKRVFKSFSYSFDEHRLTRLPRRRQHIQKHIPNVLA